jgi:ATP-binding cassette, subfamily B, bacterial
MIWWRRIAASAVPYRRRLGVLGLVTVIDAVLVLLAPWPLKLIVDQVLAGKPLPDALRWLERIPLAGTDKGLVVLLASVSVVAFGARRLIVAAVEYLKVDTGRRMSLRLGADVFEHLQHQQPHRLARRTTGDLLARVTGDSNCVQDLVMGVGLNAFTAMTSLGFMLAVMWLLSAPLALIALAAAVPLGLLIRLFAGPMAERSLDEANREGELMARAEQTLEALPDVQGYAGEDLEDAQFDEVAAHRLRAGQRTHTSHVQFELAINAVMACGIAAITIAGGLLVADDRLTLGDLLVFLAYLLSLYTPLESLAYLTTSYGTASGRARRVIEVLESDEAVRDPVRPRRLPASVPGRDGGVGFEAVTYGYEPGRPVLHGVDLVVEPGETVALVGHTGAGKTTLVSLIPRFVDPWVGSVTLDGIDLRELAVRDVRDRVAFVRQEAFVLPTTIVDNIAYGRPGAGRREIEAAAEAANAAEFIERLSDGYDTVVGERGATLSGGQRQRLTIARALLKDAPILVLDEPTSALDAESEALLLEALERLTAQRTVLVIAHRLSTVRHADRVVVMEHGRILEQGTHTDLLTAGGTYARFHRLQVEAGWHRGR